MAHFSQFSADSSKFIEIPPTGVLIPISLPTLNPTPATFAFTLPSPTEASEPKSTPICI
jgi:hypothetical protein